MNFIKHISGFFILFVTLSAVAQDQNCWPNARGNEELTGYTDVKFPTSVQIAWAYDAEGIFKSAPVVCSNKIIVGSTAGELLCLDLEGKLLWKFKTENAIEAPAFVKNERVYIGDLSGMFYALNLANGEKIWEYKTENQIMGAPAYYEKGGREILAVGSYDYYLHGIDAKNGKGLWKYESDNFLNSAPAVVNGKAVFGGCDGYLHQVDMLTGQLAGKTEIATYVASSPSIVENTAYIGDYDGGFTAINLESNSIKWRFENGDSDLPFIASPAVSGNNILIGCRDKFMYCLDMKAGTVRWKRNTGSRVDASAIANKNHVLLINMRGDVMVLNIEDGSIVWNYELGVPSISGPAVIGNTIVIAGSDGNVYCLKN